MVIFLSVGISIVVSVSLVTSVAVIFATVVDAVSVFVAVGVVLAVRLVLEFVATTPAEIAVDRFAVVCTSISLGFDVVIETHVFHF